MPVQKPYSPVIDRYSQQLFDEARRLAADDQLGPGERQAKLEHLAERLERGLSEDFRAGVISREQYDGGRLTLDGIGGERGELQRAKQLVLEILAKPDAAGRLRQVPGLFTSDVFHNLTLTGTTTDGRMAHVRFGTHGGLELRGRAPSADGFPFPGSKWVEGEIVIGDRIYSFVDMYTDNLKIDLDREGRPAALRFRGEVSVKSVKGELLADAPDKWTKGLPATVPEGRAVVELTLPLSGTDGPEKLYGAGGVGFRDRNFALASRGGKVTIAPPEGGRGPELALELGEATGAMEEGQYRNVPAALPAAYSYVQGQRLDTESVLARALEQSPGKLLDLFTSEPLLRELRAVRAGSKPAADLAKKLDADLRERAKRDPELRRRAASLLVPHLASALLPGASERATATQFEARLLSESAAARLVSAIAGALADEAGSLHPSGVFRSYEEGQDPLRRNPDHVDPVAVLNVNHVPVWRKSGGGMQAALLERRTVLLFDDAAGRFLIGFQEVFHARP